MNDYGVMLCNNHVKSHGACAHGMHVCGPQAIRVFNVWRRGRILAARVVGENKNKENLINIYNAIHEEKYKR